MKYKCEIIGESLVIHFENHPNWDDFAEFGEMFFRHCDFKASEKHTGVDRICWVFSWDSNLYSFNFEHYSDQVWLESLQPEIGLERIFDYISNA